MDVSLSDEGVYFCIAENELGSISKEVQVVIEQGKKAKQEQNMKCKTDIVNTKRIEDTDVSGSGSGNDDDGGDDDDDVLSDADDISPTNDGISTSPQP
ncbi:---NA--- [Paramuricea clavata]|uniref:---NA n=1 Tax=Paramuricea clavata TaxID=317549 RepID=A0A6S7KJQ1_PARCT|nr:---NA--- [Paramuricea clavata]